LRDEEEVAIPRRLPREEKDDEPPAKRSRPMEKEDYVARKDFEEVMARVMRLEEKQRKRAEKKAKKRNCSCEYCTAEWHDVTSSSAPLNRLTHCLRYDSSSDSSSD